MIRVVLADDQGLVRTGFRLLVDSEPGLRVVGEAADGATAVALARTLRPDVVLMDIRMPGQDGLAATREISADPDLSAVRVVVLTTFGEDDYLFEALHAGASGFLLKDIEPAELLRAVRVVHAGDALLSPRLTRTLIADYARRARRPRAGQDLTLGLARLTAREREVLVLVGQGLSNTEIAAALTLSPATAKTHVGRIMAKLDARDRARLVVLAYESGLVVPGR